jgi:hypothetical protein
LLSGRIRTSSGAVDARAMCGDIGVDRGLQAMGCGMLQICCNRFLVPPIDVSR